MENQAEYKNNSTPAPSRDEKLGWIIDQLAAVALAKGQVYEPGRLRINAEDLMDIPQVTLSLAFKKSRTELDYLPQVSEIRRLAFADEKSLLDGEKRAAWEVVMSYGHTYVGNDPFGNYGPEHGWFQTAPQLPPRILDSVRRSGGWKSYKCMTDDDFPFLQKRFFEEFMSWTSTSMALPAMEEDLRELPPPMIARLSSGGEVVEIVPVRTPTVRKFGEKTEDFEARRARLKDQAAELCRKAQAEG